MTKLYFGSIDFYEAIMLIDLGFVDFDKTYQHVTKKIREWEEKWKQIEKIQYAKVDATALVIQIDEKKFRIDFTITRPDLLSAVALLINLRIPQSVDAVEEVILNLFQPTEFTITQ